jgi:hypothetical protein
MSVNVLWQCEIKNSVDLVGIVITTFATYKRKGPAIKLTPNGLCFFIITIKALSDGQSTPPLRLQPPTKKNPAGILSAGFLFH